MTEAGHLRAPNVFAEHSDVPLVLGVTRQCRGGDSTLCTKIRIGLIAVCAGRSMKYVQRWAWLAGALATVAAAAFVVLTMRGIADSSRAAGDLGEMRAFAERISSAGMARDEVRFDTLVRARWQRTSEIEPAVAEIVGEVRAREAFAALDQRFTSLEAATRRGVPEEQLRWSLDIAAQVDALLDDMAQERERQVDAVRRLAVAGLVLTLGSTAVIAGANLLDSRRMRELSRRVEAANQRYQSVVASMQNGILVMDGVGIVTYCNRALAQMLGYEADELIGMPGERLIPLDRAAEFDAYHRRVIELGWTVSPALTQRLSRDGAPVDVMIAVTPIEEDGRRVATLSELRDVTPEMHLRQQVRLEVTQRESILDAAPVPIVVIDDNGTILAANPAVYGTLGWMPEEIVGHGVEMLMPEPFASGHAGYLHHYLDTGEASTDTGLVVGHDRPTFALHREGFQIPISLQVAEASTGDGHRVFTGVIHDLTQQSHREGERLQMLESLMRNQRGVVVGTMVGGVAHDFNNLLTAIVGALDLEISARGQSSRWLDHAAGAARRAAVVVRRLLHAARPGGSELLPTDVREAIRETVELARETFDRRVVIRIAAGPDVPLVLADATRIEQVLLNLLLNARDATLDRIESAGSGYAPEIHIAAGATQADDGTPIVRITISDNGVGMTAAVRDRLFDPFFTTKGADHGTGLGMTMVREIVREFDGSISVESTYGVGTTFTLDLPVSIDDAPMSLTESPSGKRRILVVDDEETIRDIVGEALKRAGYDSVGVPNAEEAIEVLRFAARFDLVLLNLNMAGLSGWDALSWIHAHQAGVPVVIMSGSVRIAEASRRGATAVLEKPFPVDSLLAVVESALNSPAGGSGASESPPGR